MNADLNRHITTDTNAFSELEKSDVSQNTRKVYRENLGYVSDWMTKNNYSDKLPLSASMLKHYAQDMVLEEKRLNTIRQRLSAVGWLHKYCGYSDKENPLYDPDMRSINRNIKTFRVHKNLDNKPQQKDPLTTVQIKKICRHLGESLIDRRDKLLFLIGFHAGLRRSELASLKDTDIAIHENGKTAVVTLNKAKGDRFNTGQTVVIHAAKDPRYCPLITLSEFRQAVNLAGGYLFTAIFRGVIKPDPIKPDYLNRIIKARCKQVNIDPKNIACHSLRRGVLIAAAENGASINTLRVHARHSKSSTTEHYIGPAHLKSGNASKGVLD